MLTFWASTKRKAKKNVKFTHFSRSLLISHQSIMCFSFSSCAIFGQISIGRYFSYNFLDSLINDFGSDLHLLNIPNDDNTGFPSSVFCLVSVKSKSVTTCSSWLPPLTISLIIRSTRSGSLILQFGRASTSKSLNRIVCPPFVVMMKRCVWRWTISLVDVVRDDSNWLPTKRFNLYACEAKLSQ